MTDRYDGTARLHFGVNIQGHESLEELAQFFSDLVDDYAKDEIVSWWDMLLEKAFRVGAESGPDELRAQLETLIAFAEDWHEDIGMRIQ